MPLQDIALHRKRFNAYYQTYASRFNLASSSSSTSPASPATPASPALPAASPARIDQEHLQLKWQHSLNVLSNAEKILAALKLPAELTRAAQLAALYHDVARFEQYMRFKTFRDQESANHGLWGSKILKQQNFLANESDYTTRLVRAAVGMHNRFVLPAQLAYAYQTVTKVVRDADKIDILRVLAEYMKPGGKQSNVVTANLPDQPKLWSQAVYADVIAGRNASYTDMRYLNDFRLVLGSWVYALNFEQSRNLIAAQGHWAKVLAGLPEGEEMNKLKLVLNKALYTNL